MKLRKFVLMFGITAALGMLAIVGVLAVNADATTINVTSTLDEPDVPGNDTCASSPSGVCTLRAAVMFANERDGKDTIEIKLGTYVLTRNGADDTALNGDLDVTDDVLISGAGRGLTFIDGNAKTRIFDLRPGTRVDMDSMTLRNGNGSTVGGSAIRADGFEANLTYLIVENNKNGAAIQNDTGEMSFYRMVVRNNDFGTTPGPGGVWSFGVLQINQSLIHNNHGFGGGGISAQNSTIIVNSTISGNRADVRGGGIEFGNVDLPVLLDLSNVTITGNHANLDGENSSGGGGGVSSWDEDEIVKVRNSIIAKNVDEGFNTADDSAIGHDCNGKFTSDRYNLIGDGHNCAGFANGVNHDKVGTTNQPLDPKLGTLANNGGFTFTHALLDGSPAIDAGNFQDGCKDRLGNTLTVDQRGFARPVDGGGDPGPWCDMGAVEAKSTGFPTKTPTVASCDKKPDAPTLALPVNGSTTKKRVVSLDWDGTLCTTKYKVLVKQDAPTGPKADNKTVQTSSYITDPLPRGHTYFWRVKSCNSFGCTKSNWFSFTVLNK